MADVVETREPAVVREERVEHVHDGAPRSNTGTIVAIIVLVLLLIALFMWRPWASMSSGGGTNINVTAPTGGTTGR
ncbi:MAG TPA: hypothetical protein VFI84_01280 [Candidatus Saccharimonadales bacterium]|nr:hypothetical protein [Candidatus Saccharimonadales bacterium]